MAFELFVNGMLMRGLNAHHNLEGAEFVGEARTAPRYRIHSINDEHPGMYKVEVGGVSVPGEIYRVPEQLWPALAKSEPANLYRGWVVLEDGREIYGMLYPRELAEGRQQDISSYGGWRSYLLATGLKH